jgi:uncharacterized protein (DUF697 family)
MTAEAETAATAEPAATVETTVPPEVDSDDAINAALDAADVIKTHVIAAMTVGLVPLPGVDMAGTVAIQVRMVNQICQIYGVTLRDNAAKATVLSLAGGLLPATLANGFVSGLKIIPGLGSLAGAAGSSLLGGAMTYAIGRVFHEHLETHESLIDFNPTKANAAMRHEFDKGVQFARSLRSKVTNRIIAKEAADTAAAAEADVPEASHAPEDLKPVAA